MTQEEKELLSKDLSSRLFYRVICHANKINIDGELLFVNKLYNIAALYYDNAIGKFESCSINDIKPYLRPMSSMTDEEQNEFDYLRFRHDEEGWLDFVLSRHLDWRGLIEKGLAFEATEGMYNLEKK